MKAELRTIQCRKNILVLKTSFFALGVFILLSGTVYSCVLFLLTIQKILFAENSIELGIAVVVSVFWLSGIALFGILMWFSSELLRRHIRLRNLTVIIFSDEIKLVSGPYQATITSSCLLRLEIKPSNFFISWLSECGTIRRASLWRKTFLKHDFEELEKAFISLYELQGQINMDKNISEDDSISNGLRSRFRQLWP